MSHVLVLADDLVKALINGEYWQPPASLQKHKLYSLLPNFIVFMSFISY